MSDVVARASLAPTSWLNLTYRTRLDHKTFATRMADALATVGVPKFSVNAGYIYTTYNPYTLFDQPLPPPRATPSITPRNEVTARRLIELGQVSVQRLGTARSSNRTRWSPPAPMRSTRTSAISWISGSIDAIRSYNGDNGATTALIQMTFKTIGQFGFKAL